MEWESYEQVATFLLNQFADEFGLERVEGKQDVVGEHSGTTWEIDAKGFRKKKTGFVIVECRRYTTSKLNQEKIASLAYRIMDTKATGGIVVSPLGLQEGAEKLAAAENIIAVTLRANSTPYEYLLSFLKKMMLGVHDSFTMKDSMEWEARDKDGNIIGRGRSE